MHKNVSEPADTDYPPLPTEPPPEVSFIVCSPPGVFRPREAEWSPVCVAMQGCRGTLPPPKPDPPNLHSHLTHLLTMCIGELGVFFIDAAPPCLGGAQRFC